MVWSRLRSHGGLILTRNMAAKSNMVPITGNTFPVKDQLKSIGARWNPDDKLWMITPAKLAEANSIVSAAPVLVPGKCSKCGATCKEPYTLCLKCKPAFKYTRCKQCGAQPNSRGWPRIYRNGICSDCYRDANEEAEMGY